MQKKITAPNEISTNSKPQEPLVEEVRGRRYSWMFGTTCIGAIPWNIAKAAEISWFPGIDLITSYGGNFGGPFTCYFLTRMALIDTTNSISNRIKTAAFWLGLSSAIETFQYFEPKAGTFDPKDYICYAVGALSALALDFLIDKVTDTTPNQKLVN